MIRRADGIHQIFTLQTQHIEFVYPDLRQIENIVFGDGFTQRAGIFQQQGIALLTQHLTQFHHAHLKTQRLQMILVERRTQILAHRRQLRRIAHQHQLAMSAAIDIFEQIFQQTSAAKHGGILAGIANHRSFIDKEDAMVVQIFAQTETAIIARHHFLTINFLVNGGSLMLAVGSKDFGRSAGRRHQHRRHFHLVEKLDERRHQGGFSRTGIAFQHENLVVFAAQQELQNLVDSPILIASWLKTKKLQHLRLDLFKIHLCSTFFGHKSSYIKILVLFLPVSS